MSLPAWRIVPRAEAPRRQPAADQRARGLLREGWARLVGSDDRRSGDEEYLQPLASARIDALVPRPPNDLQRAALHTAWGEAERLVVVRPGDGSWDDVLARTPPAGGETLPPPPEPPFATGLPDGVLRRLADPAPLHLARLEGWFVRHHDGVAALRSLLSALGARHDPWSVDVTSWAWVWMEHVLPEVRTLPAPHVVAPLDGDALAAWLDPPPDMRVRGRDEGPGEPFFRALASRAEGEAGVASAVWRACLHEGAERAGSGTEADDAALWVRHPADVELPRTDALSRDDLIVLHAVLIHHAGTLETIRRALPLDRGTVEGALAQMVARGLAGRDEEGRYRIRAEAVPAVRGRLRAEAFVPGDA